MSNQSKFGLRQILLIATMGIGFLGFAVMPIINLFQANSTSPVSSNGKITKEQLLKQLEDEDKSYQKILDREPKNPLVLQKVIQARLEMYKVTDNVQKLKESLAPLDELIKQNPKDKNLPALKKQIESIISKEGKKPNP